MKRFIFALVFLCLLWVVGCNNKEEIDKPEVDRTASMPTTAATDIKPDENPNTGIEASLQSDTKNSHDDDIQGIAPYIPSGWHVLKKYDGKLAIAEGDLNKDGLNDKAFVIEESTELDSPRNLLVVFGSQG